jgi:spore coat polysaccharide biosynthesis protein SpsF
LKNIIIGIQSRSDSTRLPRKAFELIGGKTMTDRVIDACKRAAAFLNREPHGWYTDVVLLTPEGDAVAKSFSHRCPVVEGPALDVLARYQLAVERFNAAYIVRVTGDCPLIPSHLITKLIKLGRSAGYDYLSNADERFRTSVDGADCEVISRTLFDEMAAEASTPYDREHVTPWARRQKAPWKIGAAIEFFDQTDKKLSVDTPEDLERVRSAFDSANDKYRSAVLTYGQSNIHWI